MRIWKPINYVAVAGIAMIWAVLFALFFKQYEIAVVCSVLATAALIAILIMERRETLPCPTCGGSGKVARKR
jgi:hypothetical protein